MALGENIRAWRERRGWSTHQLAVEADVGQSGISRFEQNKRRPRPETLRRIAKALGAEVAQLEYGAADLEVVPVGKRRIPVLSYAQAGCWVDADDEVISDEEIAEYLITGAEYSSKTFALIVRGESMEPKFHNGDRIIVEPAAEAMPGDFVIALNDAGETTFKQLALLGRNERGQEVRELRPLNPVFPSWNSLAVPFRIVGPVIEVMRRIRPR